MTIVACGVASTFVIFQARIKHRDMIRLDRSRNFRFDCVFDNELLKAFSVVKLSMRRQGGVLFETYIYHTCQLVFQSLNVCVHRFCIVFFTKDCHLIPVL